MEDSIRRQIMSIRSKYCEPILELLAREGELYHGDLSEKLNMSPSGLNVIIKKMQECDPPIIEILQIGKYKIYTLPPSVKEYMESRREAGSGRGGSAEKTEETVVDKEQNVLLSLQHFADKAGAQWKDMLNLLLQDRAYEGDAGIRSQFAELMRAVVFAGKYREEDIERLKEFIRNDVLNRLLEEYLEEVRECERHFAGLDERLRRHVIIQ